MPLCPACSILPYVASHTAVSPLLSVPKTIMLHFNADKFWWSKPRRTLPGFGLTFSRLFNELYLMNSFRRSAPSYAASLCVAIVK
jgi:hypothetical protein